MATVNGVGPDAPIVTLEGGGRQSQTPARLDLIPMRALLHVGAILQEGAAKYGINNWRSIPVESHLNKAMIHIAAFLLGDTQDDHIGHACCRLQMALEKHLMNLEAKSE